MEKTYTYSKAYTAEGYSNGLSGSTYSYYRRDHLGNNREVWTTEQVNYGGTIPAFTSQRTQYYPSGLPWAEGIGAGVQNKKYNGKEWIEMHGLDEYDSQARMYYPAIMRTTTIDPLAEKYYSISPYAWCGNNPVRIIDLNGMDWVETANGDITWRNDVTKENYQNEGVLGKDETYRGTSYQREKIWTNHIVKGNSESGLMQESYNSDGNMTYNNLTPWIDVAFEELGTARLEGSASNPRIEEYLTYTQLKGKDINDATSWCAGFANFALETGGVDGTGSAKALSFRNWGVSLDAPAYGSVATISYGGGYGHVGFVVGVNSKGQILILGGNQGAAIRGGQNEVNISPNSISSFKYNYPGGLSPYYKLPTLNISGKSISYGNTR